mgnify:CR=1 FL=1
MQVILLERIRNLGDLGDEVNVKNGYGRNFLIPQGKAVRATADNREQFEARRAELQAQADERLGAARARGDDAERTAARIASLLEFIQMVIYLA